MKRKKELNIDETKRSIVELFKPFLSDLREEAQLVTLSPEFLGALKNCKKVNEVLEYAGNRIVSFTLPWQGDSGEVEWKYYIGVIGDLKLSYSADLVKVRTDSWHLYPMHYFGNIGLKKGVNDLEINEFISPILDEDGEIDQEQLLTFFSPFSVYQANVGDLLNEENLTHLIYLAFLKDDGQRKLPFSDELTNEFIDALGDRDFDIILTNSFIATTWQACYFEIYKCIEPLFNNILAKLLKKEFSFSGNHRDITERLKNNGAMIPDERSNIENLFAEALSAPLASKFTTVLRLPADTSFKVIGRRIYAIRNAIVHHPDSASSKKDVESGKHTRSDMKLYDWDDLCLTLLQAYRAFKTHMAGL